MDFSELPANLHPFWHTVTFWVTLLAALATGIATLHVKFIKPVIIVRVIHPIKRHFKVIQEITEVIQGLKEMKVTEVLAEFKELSPKLRQVCRMVLPNHGSSMPDGISRIEAQLLQLSQSHMTSEAIQEAMLLDHPKAVFIANDKSHNTFVNKKYAESLNCDREDLLGMGWRSYLMPEELIAYDMLWRSAFTEFRDSFFTLRMRNKKGNKAITYSVKLTVLRSPQGTPTGQFMGTMDEVNPEV